MSADDCFNDNNNNNYYFSPIAHRTENFFIMFFLSENITRCYYC